MPTTLRRSGRHFCYCKRGVLTLLLIGVVNLGNLFLVRAGSRAKEHAVRQALGASRKHIASEVLVETTLLTLGGGLLGLAVADGGIRLLSALAQNACRWGARSSLTAAWQWSRWR